jgi:hypothetical protein
MIVGMGIVQRIARLFGGRDAEAPERLPSPDELVLLTRPESEPEALMLRELLDEHGVRALIKNLDAATAQSGAAGPSWAYEMWVLRKDLRRARDVLGLGGDG